MALEAAAEGIAVAGASDTGKRQYAVAGAGGVEGPGDRRIHVSHVPDLGHKN